MAISPLSNKLSEFLEDCEFDYGNVACVVFNYDTLLTHPHPATSQCFQLSPRSLVIIKEALASWPEERWCWTTDQGPPTDAEWATIKSDVDRAHLELSQAITCP